MKRRSQPLVGRSAFVENSAGMIRFMWVSISGRTGCLVALTALFGLALRAPAEPPANQAHRAADAGERIAFRPPVRILGSELPQVAGFHVCDWNGDGQPDIFGTSGGLQTFQVCYTRKGPQGREVDPGLYLPPNLTEVFPERPSSLGPVQARWTWVGDWFNSGKLDILLSERAVILIRNRGTSKSPILVETVNLQGTEKFQQHEGPEDPPHRD
jgi:hypothetical protein